MLNLTYEQIIKAMELNGFFVWELYLCDAYNNRLIATNDDAEEGSSKKKLDDVITLYSAQNPNVTFGIVLRKTKASSGNGLLPLQRFTRTGVSSLVGENTPPQMPQMQMMPDIQNLRDKIFEDRITFEREKSSFEIQKALFEYEKKHWVSSNEDKEKALKDLEKKFNSNSEAAADGVFRGLRLVYEEIAGKKVETPIAGVESNLQEEETNLTPNEQAYSEFFEKNNEFINSLSPENCAKSLQLIGNVFQNIQNLPK